MLQMLYRFKLEVNINSKEHVEKEGGGMSTTMQRTVSSGSGIAALRRYPVESAAAAWITGQVAAYVPQWLAPQFPGWYWRVFMVRPMGHSDGYNYLFANRYPCENECRLVVMANCGREYYRLDVVSFDADRLGQQLVVVPVVAYLGEEMPV
jgi:hypothetical protein